MNSTAGIVGMAIQVAEVKSESLRTRVVSGVILAPLALGLVWLGGWYFTGLVIVAGVLMVREWDLLCAGTGKGINVPVLMITIASACYLAGTEDWQIALLVGLGGTVVASLLNLKAGPLWTTLGAIYILVPIISLIWLRNDSQWGLLTIVWMLLCVWATDTGAYFSGKAIGGPKMAPRISPNKTWAGLIGGILAAAIVSIAVGVFAGAGSILTLAVAGGLVAIIGQIGDVCESSVKRKFGVKDSGNIIPGHGGLFDRLDSLLFVSVVVAVSNQITGKAVVWQ